MNGERTLAVLWDMDGTLVDTAEYHYRAWKALADEAGEMFTRDDFAATFGMRNPEILAKLYPGKYDSTAVSRLGDRKEVLYRAAVEQGGVDFLPGVRALVEALHAAGSRQAIASSAPRANLELILRLTGATALFAALVSAEDVRRGKPDPEVFQTAASRLSAAATTCVVMEDAVAGVQAAKAAGMACVAVTFVGHHPAEKLHAAGADVVVPTLEAVTVAEVRRLIGG
jgi:beta-phosphoglucomutase